MQPFDSTSRPHAPRQRHGRQEAAAPGVSVETDLRLAVCGNEVQPVPERRQRVAAVRRGIVAIERRGKKRHGPRVDDVSARLGPADPALELFGVELRRHRNFRYAPVRATPPMRFLRTASQIEASATAATNGSATAFMRSQPAASMSAPDDSDDTPITVKTMKSFRPCVFAFSCAVYASVSSVVPPVYIRFQPTQISTRAKQK